MFMVFDSDNHIIIPNQINGINKIFGVECNFKRNIRKADSNFLLGLAYVRVGC